MSPLIFTRLPTHTVLVPSSEFYYYNPSNAHPPQEEIHNFVREVLRRNMQRMLPGGLAGVDFRPAL